MHQVENHRLKKTKKRQALRSLPLLVSVLPALPITAVLAEDDSLTVTTNALPAEGYSTDTASTGSKTNTPLNEVPQSVSVVTPEVINDFQVKSVNDAMKFVSGVTQGNTLGGTEDGFVKRGFGVNSDGSVFIDGIRSNQGLSMDATTDRVEVLKGSASLLYGILSPGGIINLIGKKPHVGRRAGDPENSFTMPAYTVADAFIAWDSKLVGKHTQIKLNVKNLFNREYYASSAGNLRVIEGEPRSLSLQATVDF